MKTAFFHVDKVLFGIFCKIHPCPIQKVVFFAVCFLFQLLLCVQMLGFIIRVTFFVYSLTSHNQTFFDPSHPGSF